MEEQAQLPPLVQGQVSPLLSLALLGRQKL
jgi:hypothetical protein